MTDNVMIKDKDERIWELGSNLAVLTNQLAEAAVAEVVEIVEATEAATKILDVVEDPLTTSKGGESDELPKSSSVDGSTSSGDTEKTSSLATAISRSRQNSGSSTGSIATAVDMVEEESLGEGAQLAASFDQVGRNNTLISTPTDQEGTRRITLLSTKSPGSTPFDGEHDENGVPFRFKGVAQFDSFHLLVKLCWKTDVMSFISFFAKIELTVSYGRKWSKTFITKPVWITAMYGQTEFKVAVDKKDYSSTMQTSLENGKATLTYNAILHGVYCVNITRAGPGRSKELSKSNSLKEVVFVSDCISLHMTMIRHALNGATSINTKSLYAREYAQVLQVMHGIPVNVEFMRPQLKTYFCTNLWELGAYYLNRLIRKGNGGLHCDNRIACATFHREQHKSVLQTNTDSTYTSCIPGNTAVFTDAELVRAYKRTPSIEQEELDNISSTVGLIKTHHAFEGQIDVDLFCFHSTQRLVFSHVTGPDLDNPEFVRYEEEILRVHPMARFYSPLPHLLFSVQVDLTEHVTTIDAPLRVVKPVGTHTSISLGLGYVENRHRYVHVEMDDFVSFDLAREPSIRKNTTAPVETDRDRDRVCVRFPLPLPGDEEVDDGGESEYHIDQSLLLFQCSTDAITGAQIEAILQECNIGRRGFLTFLLCLYGIPPTAVNTYAAVRDAIVLAGKLNAKAMINLLELEMLKALKDNQHPQDGIATARGTKFVSDHNLQIVANYICTHEDYRVFVKLCLREEFSSFKRAMHVL